MGLEGRLRLVERQVREPESLWCRACGGVHGLRDADGLQEVYMVRQRGETLVVCGCACCAPTEAMIAAFLPARGGERGGDDAGN